MNGNKITEYGESMVYVFNKWKGHVIKEYIPINEKHPFQGQSPYSASKIGADKIAESFYRSFSTPIVVSRPFNTYGPRQSARAIIPTVITQLLNGHNEICLGSPHQQGI